MSGQPSPRAPVLAGDAAGVDLADLPRYPGAVRVAFTQSRFDGLETTTVRYEAVAHLEPVRAFYRQTIEANGWTVGDVTYSERQWAFLLISGTREAILKLVSAGPNVTIAIQLGELVGSTTIPVLGVATPRPTAPPQPALPSDDGGGDGRGAGG